MRHFPIGPSRVLRTIRGRILFYLFLTVVPLVGLAFFLAFDEHKEEDARARLEEQTAVQVISGDIDRLFRMTRDVVSGASQKSLADMCRWLVGNRASFPEFHNLGVLEIRSSATHARLICSAEAISPSEEVVLTPEEQQLASGLKQAGDIVVTPIRTSVTGHVPVMPVAALAEGEHDELRQIAVATLDLNWLSSQVNRLPLPLGAILLVLDRNGRIAARNPPSAEWQVGGLAPPFEQTLPKRTDFNDEIVGEGGVSRFYVLRRIGAADGLTVIMKRRSESVFRGSRQHLMWHLIGLFALSLIIFAGVSLNAERYVAAPLAALGKTADQLAAGDRTARSHLDRNGEIGRLALSFNSMADAIQREQENNIHLISSLRALRARMDAVSEEERTRIARELHDELGQQLTAMKWEIAKLEEKIRALPPGTAPDSAHDSAEDLSALVDVAIRDMRRIATELRPAALDEAGLSAAIQSMVSEFSLRTGIPCDLRIPAEMPHFGALDECLFRTCQECLTNIARHADAKNVHIQIAASAGEVTVSVADDGRGFTPEAQDESNSLGMLGMRERVRAVNGSIVVKSAPGHGATIEVRLPLEHIVPPVY